MPFLPLNQQRQSTEGKDGNQYLKISTNAKYYHYSHFSRTTWASRYQKGKTSLDLNEARDDGAVGWQWH